MSAPADLPAADRYVHGTRARYVAARCRCQPCRAANTAYYHARRAREVLALAELGRASAAPKYLQEIVRIKVDPRTGQKVTHRFKNPCPGLGRTPAEEDQGCPWSASLRRETLAQGVCARCRAESVADYLVDAARARRHILHLSRKGVGRRSISAACDVAVSILTEIRAKRKTQIRLTTERRILSVTAAALADGADVDAGPTWSIVAKLRGEGFTLGRIAREALGNEVSALQIRRGRVRASTAHAIDKFYRLRVELGA